MQPCQSVRGASCWSSLRVPGNIALLHPPPYSPELSLVENAWAYLCGNKLSNREFNIYEAIADACRDA